MPFAAESPWSRAFAGQPMLRLLPDIPISRSMIYLDCVLYENILPKTLEK
jgi:hypothetical protein